MNKIVLVIVLLPVLVALADAQSDRDGRGISKISAVRHANWQEGQIVPGGSACPDSTSPPIWNNQGISGWWDGAHTGYAYLDWGKLPDPGTWLPDHVVDGFTFSYGTNNQDAAGENIAIYFFDYCTGWCCRLKQETEFVFNGLPNGYGLPSLPPGYGWVWTIDVDLEGTGEEFLMNRQIGMAWRLLSLPATGKTGPLIGSPPDLNGNGPTATEDAFSIYRIDSTWHHLKTHCQYFGGAPFWGSWPCTLYGHDGEINMSYHGMATRGNDASLYACGQFEDNGDLLFLVRKNDLGWRGNLLASFQTNLSQYPYFGAAFDVTQLVGNFIAPKVMTDHPIGDFASLAVHLPPGYGSSRVQVQAVLSDPPLQSPPLDASNGLTANKPLLKPPFNADVFTGQEGTTFEIRGNTFDDNPANWAVLFADSSTGEFVATARVTGSSATRLYCEINPLATALPSSYLTGIWVLPGTWTVFPDNTPRLIGSYEWVVPEYRQFLAAGDPVSANIGFWLQTPSQKTDEVTLNTSTEEAEIDIGGPLAVGDSVFFDIFCKLNDPPRWVGLSYELRLLSGPGPAPEYDVAYAASQVAMASDFRITKGRFEIFQVGSGYSHIISISGWDSATFQLGSGLLDPRVVDVVRSGLKRE